jgi:hypothetical protein
LAIDAISSLHTMNKASPNHQTHLSFNFQQNSPIGNSPFASHPPTDLRSADTAIVTVRRRSPNSLGVRQTQSAPVSFSLLLTEDSIAASASLEQISGQNCALFENDLPVSAAHPHPPAQFFAMPDLQEFHQFLIVEVTNESIAQRRSVFHSSFEEPQEILKKLSNDLKESAMTRAN